jgi:hypothetical protein
MPEMFVLVVVAIISVRLLLLPSDFDRKVILKCLSWLRRKTFNFDAHSLFVNRRKSLVVQ